MTWLEEHSVMPDPCSECGGLMVSHYRESLGTAVYYVDRQCTKCGYWERDEDGGI